MWKNGGRYCNHMVRLLWYTWYISTRVVIDMTGSPKAVESMFWMSNREWYRVNKVKC